MSNTIPWLRRFADKPDKPSFILGSHKGEGEHTQHIGLWAVHIFTIAHKPLNKQINEWVNV